MPDGAADRREPHDSIKHTLVALLIAFILTLTFRGFVMEGFIIPTGSMAPTLLGEHWRVRSPLGGHDWAINGKVGPRAPGEGIDADDPISRTPLSLLRAGRSAGDRILVLKWAYALADPSRWDAAVFKYPEAPRENFIKRIVGLPGEDVWLVDGDVFVRKSRRSSEPGAEATGHPTGSIASDDGWRIARKPDNVQRALWQPVWESESAGTEGTLVPAAASELHPPWTGMGWQGIAEGRSFHHNSAGHATLKWDSTRWRITDWNPYNDPDAPTSRDERRYFPVNDIRVRFAIEPVGALHDLTIRVAARGHTFTARAWNPDDSDPSGKGSSSIEVSGPGFPELKHPRPRAPSPRLPIGVSTTVEFWMFDQRLELWVGGERVAIGDFDWTPRFRLAAATNKGDEEIAALLGEGPGGASAIRGNPLADPTLYSPPEISIAFEGGPVTLHRLAVDRDIYYRPTVMENDPRIAARGTHPSHLARLSPDEFFALGDNSGASRDSRLWDAVDPWVAREIDSEPGVVHRALLLGKAFFVYFPSPHEVSVAGRDRPLVPDFGRMRWIR